MSGLAKFNCVPCRGHTPRLSPDEISLLLADVPGWDLVNVDGAQRLERSFPFGNFADGLDFANRIGDIADAEGHHPRLTVEWGIVTVQWWTYAIAGLHKNDFIMAAKTDLL